MNYYASHMQRLNKKTLIIAPNWVGDTIMAQCLFKLIKQIDSTTQIDVVAQDFLHPLLKCMPEITRIISLNIQHGELGLRKRHLLAKSLRQEHYTQAIVLPNSFKSALIPLLAKIPHRTGWRGEWRYGLLNDLRILNKQKLPLMVERFMQLGLAKHEPLVKPYPVPQLQIDTQAIAATKQKFSIDAQKPILALCPEAAYGLAKRWPVENFAQVASSMLDKNWRIWLFGIQNTDEINQKVQKLTGGRCFNFIGKTNLAEAINLLSLANAVVTNDSGLMHIAAALNLPLLAIYGSSSPKFTPPLNQKAKILTSTLTCSPCFARTCKFGHYKCLTATTPEKIVSLLCKY